MAGPFFYSLQSKTLGKRIRAARLAAGFSLEVFAEFTKTTETESALIEDGAARPLVAHFILMAMLTHIKISDLTPQAGQKRTRI